MDRLLKLLTVTPTRRSSAPKVVITVTPVANWPKVLRNLALSKSGVFINIRHFYIEPLYQSYLAEGQANSVKDMWLYLRGKHYSLLLYFPVSTLRNNA